MTVTVPVKLQDDVYRALVAVADKNDTQVHTLIEVAITKSVRRKDGAHLKTAHFDLIRKMNGEGLSDAQIARRIGVAQSTVSRHRGRLGLQPPQPRKGGRQKAVPA